MATKKKSLIDKFIETANKMTNPVTGAAAVVGKGADILSGLLGGGAGPTAEIAPGPGFQPSVEDLARAAQSKKLPYNWLPDGLMEELIAAEQGGGGRDPMEAVYRQLLGSLVAPDKGAFLAPYDRAEQATQAAYDAAIPRIEDAYGQLRGRLDNQLGQATSTLQQGQQNRAAQMQMGQDQVAALQAQALRDLQTQAGGQGAALGSLTGAAQAQAGANQATLELMKQQEAQSASQRQASLEGQFADRTAGADTLQTAAKDQAAQNLNAILNQIGLQRSNAEMEYAAMQQNLAQKRASVEAQMAQSQQPPSQKELLELEKLQLAVDKARQDLEQGGSEGGGPAKPLKLGPHPDYRNPADFGEVAMDNAAKNGVAWRTFNDIVDHLGPAATRTAAEKLLFDKISEAKSKGAYLPELDSVVIEGRRISLGHLRDWLDKYYGPRK